MIDAPQQPENQVSERLTASDVTDLTTMTSSRRCFLRHNSQNDVTRYSNTVNSTGSIGAMTSVSIKRTRPILWRSHFLALILLVLLQSTCVASQGTLDVRITPSQTSLYRVGQTVTFDCSVTGQSSQVPVGTNPLSWSRDGGLPSGSSIVTDATNVGSGLTQYNSSLSFVVDASVTGRVLTCSAQIGSQTGTTTFSPPPVLILPGEPVITGPSTIDAGQVNTWTCQSNGSSITPPNVYFRLDGRYVSDGSLPVSNLRLDQYGNRIYDVTVTLAQDLPGSGRLNLSCTSVHTQAESEKKVSWVNVFVRSVPVLTTTEADIKTTTEGVNTILNCQISAAYPDVTSVTWRKDGVILNPLTDDTYEDGSVSTPSLRIPSPKRNDAGSYNCSATNSIGTGYLSKEIQLVVRYKPEIVYTGGTQFQGNVGGSVTLPCPAVSVPNPSTIRWFRTLSGVDSFINVNTQAKYSGSSNVVGNYGLTINSLQESDGDGSYYCQATNDVDQTTGPSVTLVINFEPTISVDPTVTGNDGTPLELRCDVSMFPSPTVLRWYKNDVRVDVSTSGYRGGSTQVPALTIQDPSKVDTGNYSCEASNGVDTLRSTNIQVTIYYLPQISVSDVSLQKDKGETVTLAVTVDASPAISAVSWRKSGETSNIAIRGRVSGGIPTRPSLVISNLQPSDSGEYRMSATNSVGTVVSTASVFLNVRYPPQDVLITRDSQTTLRVGDQLRLTCTSSGNPTPADSGYSWTRSDGTQVATGPVLSKLAEVADNGVIRCSVTNSVGVGSADYNLVLLFAPVTNVPSPNSVFADLGTQVTLTCDVSANPEVTEYIWRRENQLVIGTGRTLTVDYEDETDLGLYTCTATNDVGSGTLTFNLQESPDAGASTGGDSGLSTVTIVLIVIVIIVALIIIILLIIFCCLQGFCAKCGGKKKEPSKVAPSYGGPIYGGERGAGFSPRPSPTKQNGRVDMDDESAPTSRRDDIPSGLIISVPEKSGGRAHHLPPLEDSKEDEIYYRNEKRRSRKKRSHKKRDDEGALTVTEGGYDPQ